MEPIKKIYVNGFTYNASAMQADIPTPQLTNDLIGGTADMPKYPPPINFENHAFFDTSVKRLPTDAGSVKFVANLEVLWHNDDQSYWSSRQQHSTYHALLRQEEMWLSFSVRFPENYFSDNHEEIFYNFGGVGGGAMSFRIAEGHFIVSLSRGEGTSDNNIRFMMGPADGGVWHDFVVYTKLSSETEVGRLTVWKDGQLARLYNPVNKEQWEVPTVNTGGVQDRYTAYPIKGYINTKIVEGENTYDVLDWKGFVFGGDFEGVVEHRWRTGLYKSGWNSNYNTTTGNINPDTYDDQSPLYIPPSQRVREIWYSNVKWQPVDSPMGCLPQAMIYRMLDVNEDLPIESPDDFDFSEDYENIEIVSPDNNSSFEKGSIINIETNIENGSVDFFVNNNLIQTISEAPYSISISDIPLNDSIVDLHFNENLLNWGTGNNSISPVNTEDITYEIGPRNYAINLGNNVLHGQKSFLVIENSGDLSEISDEFTVSFWIKSNHGSGLNPYIVHNIESVNHSGIRISVLSGGEINVYLYDGTGDTPITFRTTLNSIVSPSEYRHFAITYDGNELKWYYNLELDIQTVVGEVDISPTANWHINASSINQAGRQQLSLDDFRIYNYSISEEDIYKTVEDNFLGQLELKIRRLGTESDPVTINIVEELPTFTISATATTGGNVSGDGEYEENEEVTLTATPDSGYEFVGWEEDSSIVSTSNPYIFNAEENRTLVAVFQEIEYQLTVTYTAGGTATGSGEYTEGEQVELTATPSSGYIFTGWYRDIDLISEANPYNYTTRGQADTVQAVFELIPIPEYTITVIPSTGGTVTGGGTYEEGKAVTLSAMPQSGWTFIKWSNEATANPYSFNASENLTISAIFEEVNPEVPYIIVKGKFKIV